MSSVNPQASIADFINYWQQEGDSYARHGDYEWMASLLNGQRVLEIGCGVGFGTQALLRRGLSVLAIDTLQECLDACRQRVGSVETGLLTLLQADVAALDAVTCAAITTFNPDAVVCWLMGAPADVTGATRSDAGQAVAAYRERTHRQVAELAASLPSVRILHFVDRTVIPVSYTHLDVYKRQSPTPRFDSLRVIGGLVIMSSIIYLMFINKLYKNPIFIIG